MSRCYLKIFFVTAILLLNVAVGKAYSVFTHEALVDANWEKVVVPLLQKKYPSISAEELQQAHAYAYGGAVAPDMGYYPGGSKFFTDLVHYVRSGDFINCLLAEASTLNEYAFAIGVLCHYEGDRYGHSLGINECVPILYPRMQKKFGSRVTYADNHISHIRTEFSFDVLQTAKGNYASTAYHNFIGFKIASSLLERAFLLTYGLDAKSLFGNLEKAIKRLRWTILYILPEFTKAAWQNKRELIRSLEPSATSRSFVYRVNRKEPRSDYKRPGFLAHIISIFLHLSPKIGPLRILKFEIPGEGEEKLLEESFAAATRYYDRDIHQLGENSLRLPNIDFDTGNETSRGEYKPGDDCYGRLLAKLAANEFITVSATLKDNIRQFYQGNGIPGKTNPPVEPLINSLLIRLNNFNAGLPAGR